MICAPIQTKQARVLCNVPCCSQASADAGINQVAALQMPLPAFRQLVLPLPLKVLGCECTFHKTKEGFSSIMPTRAFQSCHKASGSWIGPEAPELLQVVCLLLAFCYDQGLTGALDRKETLPLLHGVSRKGTGGASGPAGPPHFGSGFGILSCTFSQLPFSLLSTAERHFTSAWVWLWCSCLAALANLSLAVQG